MGDFMTTKDCDRKHRVTKWALSIIFGFAILLLVVMGWALGVSSASARLSTKVERDFGIHEALQEEQWKNLNGRLQRIEATQTKQTGMLEDILRGDHGHPPGG